MWILPCLLLLLALVVIVVLFMPIRITIDSFHERASLRWGILSASITVHTGEFRYRLSAPLYHREGPLEELWVGRSSLRKPGDARRSRPRRDPVRLRSLLPVLRSFRVKRFRWYVDTGDPIWNAWLFPLFHLWRLRGQDVRVAFDGQSGLVLDINNNCFRLLKAVLFDQQPKKPRS